MGVFDPAKGQPALELKIGGNKSKITMHVIHHSPFPIPHSPFTLLSESSRLDSFTKVGTLPNPESSCYLQVRRRPVSTSGHFFSIVPGWRLIDSSSQIEKPSGNMWYPR